jgi:HSP20 family protein
MKMKDLQRRTSEALPEIWENPFGLLRRMTADMERYFDEFPSLSRWFPGETRLLHEARWMPRLDMFEKDNKLVVRADLPGMTKDDVKVEVTEDQITLQGERKREIEEEKEGLYRLERSFGSFYRSIPLPEGVRPDDVQATFEKGVLEITAPLPPSMKKTLKAHQVKVKDLSEKKEEKRELTTA